MSEQSSKEDTSAVENAECAFWVGLIALSVGVGVLYGPGWGWVAFGGPLVVLALLLAWAVANRKATERSKAGEP